MNFTEPLHRQGDVIPAGQLNGLSIQAPYAVIVTHDCDLVSDKEEGAELIEAYEPTVANEGFANCKSTRILQLSFGDGPAAKLLELRAYAKYAIIKSDLAQAAPLPDLRPSPDAVKIMRHWLSLRYKRTAFPDNFNLRLNDLFGDKLRKLVARENYLIIGVLVDLSPFEELRPTETYELEIYLLFDEGGDPIESYEKVAAIGAELTELFSQKCQNPTTKAWSHIELKNCIAVSQANMSVAVFRRLDPLNFDYVTLRAKLPDDSLLDTY